jgi:hypothetical protein
MRGVYSSILPAIKAIKMLEGLHAGIRAHGNVPRALHCNIMIGDLGFSTVTNTSARNRREITADIQSCDLFRVPLQIPSKPTTAGKV